MRKRRRSLAGLFGNRARDDAWERHESKPRSQRPWSDEERAGLRRGETVFRHGEGGPDTGLAAVVVAAPTEVIWQAVLDFDAYVEFLPYITRSERVSMAHGASCDVYDASFEITTKGVVTRYQVRHWFYATRGWLPFRMVSNESGGAVRGGEGFWLTRRWDEDWSRTLLCYEVRLETSRLVPKFMKKLAANRGLPTAATLIARRAEAACRA